ncbi:MAG: thioredoxin family protein [Methanobacterium sp.]|uniref:thioredoxin family protein n=1 Tax=Methanobacterium sp. TaxID=2164 RepID=UPI003D661DDD|nr:thioredoxin family protein [Methanobacterium sp.]
MIPYLICDKCNSYYKLQKGESIKDPQNLRFWDTENEVFECFDKCECGNKLEYYKYIGDYTKGLENRKIRTKNEDLAELWAKKSTGIKLVSILVFCSLGILLIAGISGISSNQDNSNLNTVSGGDNGNKLTIVLLSASWCPACKDLDQKTLSDPKVQEKIANNYNFNKIDVDQNKDAAMKYATNGKVTLPTIIILDANGNEIKRYEGYMTADEFLGIL